MCNYKYYTSSINTKGSIPLHYYCFGSVMADRTKSIEEGYRYGFNGMEKDVESFIDAYDFGARIYDSRLGRWLSLDPLTVNYPSLSPYNFVANMPIIAIDPDGRLIIFVNGWWSDNYWPDIGKKTGGNINHWSSSWINDVTTQIGDKKQIFVDGFGSTMLFSTTTERYFKGKTLGAQMAKEVYANVLEKGETIKFITSSMGTAFQRGVSEAFKNYVNSYNLDIEKYNAGVDAFNISLAKLKSDFPNVKFIQDMQSRTLKSKIELNIEFTLDLDAFQAYTIGGDKNAKSNYYMKANDLANGPDNTFLIGGAISGSTELGIDPKTGISTMSCHAPECAKTKYIPPSTNNGNEFYVKQYGNNNKNFVPPTW